MTEPPAPITLLRLASRLAVEAGSLLWHRPADLAAETKSTPTDAVTVMDRASEALILAGLARHRPEDPVVAEETGSRAGSGPVTWHVDPLDGTVNYLYGVPSWSVSIAAVIDGVTVAGVVYDVMRRRLFTATSDGPAKCNAQVIHHSNKSDLATALVATGFAYDAVARAAQAARLATLLPVIRDIRRFGSAALDLCAVADGSVDAYFESGASTWDWLAGQLIAERAGARTVMSRTTIGTDQLVAASPSLIDQLLVIVE